MLKQIFILTHYLVTIPVITVLANTNDELCTFTCSNEQHDNLIYCSTPKENITAYIITGQQNTINLECNGSYRCCRMPKLERLPTHVLALNVADCPLSYDMFLCTLEDFDPLLYNLEVLQFSGRKSVVQTSNTSVLFENNVWPKDKFHNLRRIKQLFINDYNIINITANSFMGLYGLDYLSIKHNPLQNIDEDVFFDVKYLREIYLIDNEIRKLSDGLFKDLDYLQTVFIADNRVPLHVESKALANLEALMYVTINNCGLNELPEDLMENSYNINILSLNHNRLTHIPNNLMKNFFRLKKIDLSYNLISILPAEDPFSQVELEEIYLDGNHIIELPDFIFGHEFQLKRISLKDNLIKRVGDHAFKKKRYSFHEKNINSYDFEKNTQNLPIKEISLAGNQITLESSSNIRIYEDHGWYFPFRLLADLESLDLSRNKITDESISNTKGWNMAHGLMNLNLSSNHITQLYNIDFKTWIRNLTVDFRCNNITKIVFSEKHNITEESNAVIILGDNPIYHNCMTDESIMVDNLQNVTNLNNLRLADVLLKQINCYLQSSYCPGNCTCYIQPTNFTVKLYCETISSLNSYQFSSLLSMGINGSILSPRQKPESLSTLPLHVHKLSLTNLQLTEAPRPPVPVSLAVLDLSNNNLTKAPLDLLINSSKLSILLKNNKLACDYTHVDDIILLKKYKDHIIDFETIKCADGKLLIDVDIANMKQLQYFKKIVIVGSLIGTFCGITILVALILLNCYRNELKVYFYAQGWCHWWVSEEELDRDKIYDAFITFSHADARFVADELVPELEGDPHDFKLCLHYRDWVVGEWITKQITQSVARSRRTIVILSENFLTSVWTWQEFREAHANALREGRARVIVILLDNVADDERLQPELRAYLSTNTYIKRDDPWFWKRLRYALPHHR